MAVDGVMGPRSIAAANALPPEMIHNEFLQLRREEYEQSPDWNTFGTGWLARLSKFPERPVPYGSSAAPVLTAAPVKPTSPEPSVALQLSILRDDVVANFGQLNSYFLGGQYGTKRHGRITLVLTIVLVAALIVAVIIYLRK